jgi:DNA-binding MarR family transcriptional regulator
MPEDFAPERCNALALRQAMRHVSQFYDQHLAASGLKGTQYSIVARLSRGGPRSINDLARDLVMDRTTLGRNLRPLERIGLVSLEVDAADRRSRRPAVTEQGRAPYERARPAAGRSAAVRHSDGTSRRRCTSCCRPSRKPTFRRRAAAAHAPKP